MRGLDGGDRGEAGSTRSFASTESPAISNSTSAARRSAETSPPPSAATRCSRRTGPWTGGPSTSVIAAWNSGSSTVSLSLWTNTTSSTRPQTGAVERRLGVMRLARELIDVRDLLRPDHVADREREDHEREPPPERLLAVRAAPARHPRREVVRGGVRVHGRPFELLKKAQVPAGAAAMRSREAGRAAKGQGSTNSQRTTAGTRDSRETGNTRQTCRRLAPGHSAGRRRPRAATRARGSAAVASARAWSSCDARHTRVIGAV